MRNLTGDGVYAASDDITFVCQASLEVVGQAVVEAAKGVLVYLLVTLTPCNEDQEEHQFRSNVSTDVVVRCDGGDERHGCDRRAVHGALVPNRVEELGDRIVGGLPSAASGAQEVRNI